MEVWCRKLKNRIGVSLFPAILTGTGAEKWGIRSPRDTERFLSLLCDAGVSSIEIRTVEPDIADETDGLRRTSEVVEIAERILSCGMEITVHGRMREIHFDAWAKNLLPVWEKVQHRQPYFPITVHPVARETNEETVAYNAELLAQFTEEASRYAGFRICLENERVRRGLPEAACCSGCAETGRRNMLPVSFTWDFGHYYYNMAVNKGTPDALPEVDFLRNVRHTHIHGLCADRDMDTHYAFPEPGILPPLRRYLDALRNTGYPGVYNLEITPAPQWEESIERMLEPLTASVRFLQDQLEEKG